MSETINDSYLGIIKYDEKADLTYIGACDSKESEVIKFSLDVEDNIREVLEWTHKIIKNYLNSNFKIYVADRLLDWYNDTWSENEIIDKNEFIDRISLESISIFNDCSAELYYLDGDLFAGHFILIDMDSEGKLGDVYIAA